MSFRSPVPVLLATLLATTALAPTFAQELDGLVASVGAESPEESILFDEATLDSLAATGVGDYVALGRFPTEVGARRPVELRRVDVYADGARIWLVDKQGTRELPRSRRLFFRGYATDSSGARIAVSLDPETRELSGITSSVGGAYEILESAGGTTGLPMVRRLGGEGLEYSCGSDVFDTRTVLDPAPFAGDHLAPLAGADLAPLAGADLATRGAAGLREGVIAIDTDNEFHYKRFNNNTSLATDWIADMFNTMNVLYERDLDLTFVQGETIFRLDTDGSPTFDDDPWTGGSGASSSHLHEFGNYWAANYSGVDRTFATLLSGKSSSGFSSSGIAWVDGYCEKQNVGGGYSINQIFTNSGVSIESNLRVIAHEFGHNLGSPHTHCYAPPVDNCYNLESGCFGGSLSCPAGGTGTLMSYCHFSTGAACGSNKLELHPTVATLMDGYVDAHYPACIGDEGDNLEIFTDGFESGNTLSWSS